MSLRITLAPAQAGQSMIFALLAPVAPGLALFLGGGAEGVAQAQLVVVFPFLGLTLGSLAGGRIIRLAGVRGAGVLAAALYAAGAAVCLAAPVTPGLLLGSALLGLGASWLTTTLSSATAIALEEPQRSTLVGLQAATASLFSIVFGLLSAFLADRTDWRAPFGVFALFGMVMFVLSALFLKIDTRQVDEAAATGSTGVLARVWPICLAGAAVFLIVTALSTELPFWLEANGVGSTVDRGILMACTTLAAAAASMAFGKASERFGLRAVAVFAGLAGAGGWLVFALWTGGLPIALLAAALIGLGLGTALPMLYSAALQAVPPHQSGQSVGYLNASIFIASFCHPWLATPLRTVWGLPGLMAALSLACAALTLCGALALAEGRQGQAP